MAIVDWCASYGISPNYPIDACEERVVNMLLSHATTHVFMHNLLGLHYDPLLGNEEILNRYPMPSRIKKNPEQLTIFPVCTVHPLEGLERAKRVVFDSFDKGAKFWRLYPIEQKWSLSHPVCRKILSWFEDERCLLLVNAPLQDIELFLSHTKVEIPLVTSLHYYDSADWFERFQHYSHLYVTTALLHGITTIQKAAEHNFRDRLLYSSNAPFGSPSSSIGLIEALEEDALRNKIFDTNSMHVLERVYNGY
jgi:hypothetical protein